MSSYKIFMILNMKHQAFFLKIISSYLENYKSNINPIYKISFHNILSIVRKYTDRPAVLYTEEKIDPFKWKEIKQLFKNVIFVKGEFLNQ
jgi:hypothetical protein